MNAITSLLDAAGERVSLWLHGTPVRPHDPDESALPREGHAPGHRHLGPPPRLRYPKRGPQGHQHHPAWLSTGGRVDRLRRNERHGDESRT